MRKKPSHKFQHQKIKPKIPAQSAE
jgi:hypothetical protein